MPMSRVTLRPNQVELAATMLADATRAAVVRAMRKSARYGHTMVAQTIAQTRPAPIATNTYRSAWMVLNTATGARLVNSARHAVFVEIGRRPGPVPFNPILEWVLVKKLRPKDIAIPKAKRRRKGEQGPKLNRMRRAQMALARAIQWKIRRHGFKGRYPLLRTMPKIQKYAHAEIRRQLARVMAAPPTPGVG